ncbi:hypothetical protein SAMN02745704_02363 [Paucidesulfovibrio gracilis DSM 16080]|uniref:Uncharacterized protein n=1 Tax=Paucidesulfovibrio gracilis DSM 16080 TaxID=1121449 RepID=A0A1T4XQ06_9BACT|nr:hypothetical protein SAMN02745704_02363 [Paucidesulfovibrio gracilis DSM 16080]
MVHSGLRRPRRAERHASGGQEARGPLDPHLPVSRLRAAGGVRREGVRGVDRQSSAAARSHVAAISGMAPPSRNSRQRCAPKNKGTATAVPLFLGRGRK